MNKWIRFYNQNRGKVIFTIIGIIFILVMVSLFNNVYKQKSKEESEKIAEEANDVEKNKYRNESKSLVSGGEVSGTKKNDFGDLIENFLSYCKNHEPAKAYGLLSNDCKNVLYPDEFIFEEQYYKTKFSTSKRYSFQSWTSSDSYIYLVKIFDDMLATGTGSSQNYIQDYFSVIEEDGQYRLNINGFCLITEMLFLNDFSVKSLISTPSIVIFPSDASKYLSSKLNSVVLPLPLLPTIATFL